MDKKKKKRHTKQLCKRRYDSSRCRLRPCLRATNAAFAAKKCVDKVCRRTLQISVTNLRLLARPPLNGSFFPFIKILRKTKNVKKYITKYNHILGLRITYIRTTNYNVEQKETIIKKNQKQIFSVFLQTFDYMFMSVILRKLTCG